MDKAEYNTIVKLLDENKIDELRKYLDKRMDNKYLTSSRKVIMNLINDDCFKKYPSYYCRKNGGGVVKIFNGVFAETESGFVLTHKNSNLFELYNDEILTPTMKDIMERTCSYNEKKKQELETVKRMLITLDKNYHKQVAYTTEENKFMEAWNMDESIMVVVPNEYYVIAHQLLGEDTKEYINKEGTGMYLKSEKGKALIMGIKYKE